MKSKNLGGVTHPDFVEIRGHDIVSQMNKTFYRKPALEIAPKLLGKHLVRKLPDGKIIRSKICEVEAYVGEEDLACHASKGKTGRTKVMYEEGGVWYVYLIYGMYHMLNVVTGEKDSPSAVLIRGVQDVSGPGRLTKQLEIDRSFNSLPISEKTGLWIEDGDNIPKNKVLTTTRIGVSYAGVWAKKPYRFLIN